MAKSGRKYVCSECGHDEIRWLGRCPSCGRYNTFVEVREPRSRRWGPASGHASAVDFAELRGGFPSPDGVPNGPERNRPLALAHVESARERRLPVEPDEMARVLGGGLVAGSVVLLGGEPGVGKSTLLTGLALRWVRRGVAVIYLAGEESPAQIRMRAERIGFRPAVEAGFSILPEVDLETALETLVAERRRQLDAASGAGTAPPCIVIVDSIQTLRSERLDAFAGSPTQLRYCAGACADFARRADCPVFLVGHVTKSGEIAGPKLLEHMVDTVLYFEGSGGGSLRLIRAVKNRFGTAGELAVFEMRSDGLAPVAEASALFLGGSRGAEPGSAVCAVRNGSRIFLVEVQALVSPTRYGTPQRVVQGVDAKRVALLAAILEKRAGLDLSGCDLFVKVAGGVRVDDPGADLAVMTALASSLREIPVAADVLVQGEVGLTGEIRGAADLADRLREAQRQGFRRAIVGGAPGRDRPPRGLELTAVARVEEAVAAAFAPEPRRERTGREG
jgi:DNA repair protein RadA/Sms